jgi:hypothetical protein
MRYCMGLRKCLCARQICGTVIRKLASHFDFLNTFFYFCTVFNFLLGWIQIQFRNRNLECIPVRVQLWQKAAVPAAPVPDLVPQHWRSEIDPGPIRVFRQIFLKYRICRI